MLKAPVSEKMVLELAMLFHEEFNIQVSLKEAREMAESYTTVFRALLTCKKPVFDEPTFPDKLTR